MTSLAKTSTAAVVFLVVLRLGIGWQLLYEGLWKIDTFRTPYPWSSDGYLKSAQGPLRPLFRSLADDANDTGWLDEAKVEARWNKWRSRFIAHYKLNDSQIGALNRMLDGPEYFAAALEKLPEGVNFEAAKVKDVVRFDAARKLLTVDGKRHLLASEKASLEAQVSDREGAEYDAYRKALNEVFTRASRLSFKERMRAHLLGNPDNSGNIDGRISQLKLYNEMLTRYEQKLSSAELPFEQEHLVKTWSDTRAKAKELAGPVMALDQELQDEAAEILTVDQVKRGALPKPWNTLKVVDLLTIAGLAGLGTLLLLGLFTRFAAFSAAFMIFGFYMAMPPLPGVPEAPGPEHSFIVNKNLIEVLALLALAFLPTGQWFGLDSLVSRFRLKKTTKA